MRHVDALIKQLLLCEIAYTRVSPIPLSHINLLTASDIDQLTYG